MSDEQRREGDREIVIVRRGSRDEAEGHHGGVWKIAYADFMTAMMAFFLVMWLVNATDKETQAAVASYFNPIKLADQQPTDRSIRDEGGAAEGDVERPDKDMQEPDDGVSEGGWDQTSTAGDETQYSEADYFENPYAVLAEIAMETGQQTNISDAGEGGAQISGPSTGAAGGEAYRDPFDPDFWSQQLQSEPVENAEIHTAMDAASAGAAPEVMEAPAEDAEAPEEIVVAPPPGEEPVEAATPAAAAPEQEEQEAEPEIDPQAVAQAEADALRSDIEAALGGINGKLAEALEVTAAEGGLLISLTDQMEESMFNVGSAVPRRDLVLAMEEIGALLASREGAVVIRGHTDARPFEGEGNDNWRLSTDRAHSAYYMLVRGGLAEERIVQVSGFADRKLKVPEDPFADDNRRIEILVQAAEEI